MSGVKILIMTVGSRGDVQPYVALGIGLREEGFRVQICTSLRFREFVEENGLEFSPLPNDLIDLLGEDTGKKAIEDMQGIVGGIRATLRLMKTVKPIIRDLLKNGWIAAKEFDPDLLVYNSKMPGVHIAEKLGIPCVLAIPFPQLVATSEIPTLGMPSLGPFNKSTYGIVKLATAFYAGLLNEFRTKTLGLEKVSRFQGLHHMTDGTAVPVLHCFSEQLLPRPGDWPAEAHITGYWFLEDDTPPSKELVEFLEQGPPPVYVGFGSMSGRRTAKVTGIVIDSLIRAEVRGIIATGWGGLAPEDLPDSIFAVNQVPHQWLFPKVSAVVHHGGAGTTAAGLRAGRPTIICPFFGDQPFWGKRVFELGLGPKPIPQKRLSVVRLSKAIKEAVNNESIKANANEIGLKIREEDGTGKAVELIKRVLDSSNN